MTILPLWAGETKSGPRVCSLHAEGPCRPFVCRVREKGRSFTHNASPDRAWRTPHHTQQTRDDPGAAENQIERRFPGRVLVLAERPLDGWGQCSDSGKLLPFAGENR